MFKWLRSTFRTWFDEQSECGSVFTELFVEDNFPVEVIVLDDDLYELDKFAPKLTGDAGIDLKLSKSISILPFQEVMVGSGLKIHLNSFDLSGKVAGIVIPRSSSRKYGVMLGNTVGLIDMEYQGEWMISIRNVSNVQVNLPRGTEICQLIVVPVLTVVPKTVSKFSRSTDRGEAGFGSTDSK